MVNLSLHIDSTSFVLTSASFAEKSISSSYAINADSSSTTVSASWAPSSLNNITLVSSSISSSYSVSTSWAPILQSTTINRYVTTIPINGPYIYTATLPFIPFRTEVGVLCINDDAGYQSGSLLDINTINGAATFGDNSTGQIFWNISGSVVTIRTTNRTAGYESSWIIWRDTTFGDNPAGGLSSWNNFVFQVSAEQ